jgi:Ni,Fe-hydrogenase I cytochrome b subunit
MKRSKRQELRRQRPFRTSSDITSAVSQVCHSKRAARLVAQVGKASRNRCNPLARIGVSMLFLLLLVQMATGFVLVGTDLFWPPFGHLFAQ